MGSALSVKNYESPADRRLAGGFLADTSYTLLQLSALVKLKRHLSSTLYKTMLMFMSRKSRLWRFLSELAQEER